MSSIKIVANKDPAGPALKIEYAGCAPAGSGVHYADEFTISLDPWIRIDPPRFKAVDNPAAGAKAASPAPTPTAARPAHPDNPACPTPANPE